MLQVSTSESSFRSGQLSHERRNGELNWIEFLSDSLKQDGIAVGAPRQCTPDGAGVGYQISAGYAGAQFVVSAVLGEAGRPVLRISVTDNSGTLLMSYVLTLQTSGGFSDATCDELLVSIQKRKRSLSMCCRYIVQAIEHNGKLSSAH